MLRKRKPHEVMAPPKVDPMKGVIFETQNPNVKMKHSFNLKFSKLSAIDRAKARCMQRAAEKML